MLLNGINSLNANAQPLVVVDGVIYDMEYNRTSLFDGFYNNLLSNISVYDIESVSVLRNGTAIYGAKGANGVILINTRRSHSFTTKIDVNISGGFEAKPKLPEMMNAGEYRTYVSEMLGTTGAPLIDLKFLREDPNYYYYKVYHNNTDWTKQVYRDEAFLQQYNINVQGGDDVADYNLSVGFARADATLKKNDFTRFNLRLNSDVKLTHNAKMVLLRLLRIVLLRHLLSCHLSRARSFPPMVTTIRVICLISCPEPTIIWIRFLCMWIT